jgi:surface polysaccharide O-acyltransferase-like enzyme
MKLDKSSSERLNLLRFPLIVGVIFLHAKDAEVSLAGGVIGIAQSGWFSEFIRELISQEFARVAVPLFYLISGYLFFLGFEWSLDNYKRKVFSRVNTLLIPYVFWNVLTLLIMLTVQTLPATQEFLSGTNRPILSYGLYDYLKDIFGIGQPPIADHFWFVRDLMIMVLFVPLIQVFLRFIPRIFIILIGILWFFDWWAIDIPAAPAVMFFCLGAFLAVAKQNIFKYDRFGKIFFLSYAIVLAADFYTKGVRLNGYIHQVGILLGILSALYATKLIAQNKPLRSFLLWAASGSFFVYAAHQRICSASAPIEDHSEVSL